MMVRIPIRVLTVDERSGAVGFSGLISVITHLCNDLFGVGLTLYLASYLMLAI
jgi:hypothetical protein